jgi:hypothetical protein
MLQRARVLGLFDTWKGDAAALKRRFKEQAASEGFGFKVGGSRVVAVDDGIAAQELARIALQAALQTVRKKTHRGERRNRQRDGQNQQAQFAGTNIAPQGAPSQAPD